MSAKYIYNDCDTTFYRLELELLIVELTRNSITEFFLNTHEIKLI
jgi:hypothetical protein